jgi:hypothetical protein
VAHNVLGDWHLPLSREQSVTAIAQGSSGEDRQGDSAAIDHRLGPATVSAFAEIRELLADGPSMSTLCSTWIRMDG